ncbi:MAG: hypothetical protein RBU27_05035 [Bacteroidota bacterium]|jgi:hypothetical protein|nr:hypothetical protein [Bacteroidota bacterium]
MERVADIEQDGDMDDARVLPLWCIVALALLCSAHASFAQVGEEDVPDTQFFLGSYTLIGKVLEGTETFMGLLVLEADSTGARVFRRIIGADTLRGTWGIEFAIGEEVRVIRIRWARAGRSFECTYQWCMDFDSYPRLSGHCYESGMATDSPGMEVGFARWPEWEEEMEPVLPPSE